MSAMRGYDVLCLMREGCLGCYGIRVGVVAILPRMGVVFAQTHSHIFSIFKSIQRYSTLFCGENGTYRARHIHIFSAFYVMR